MGRTDCLWIRNKAWNIYIKIKFYVLTRRMKALSCILAADSVLISNLKKETNDLFTFPVTGNLQVHHVPKTKYKLVSGKLFKPPRPTNLILNLIFFKLLEN